MRPDADWAIPLAWAAERGQQRARIQVAPRERRAELDAALDAAGWSVDMAVDVLAKPLAPARRWTKGSDPFVTKVVDERWMAAWAEAEGRADSAAHLGLFGALAGRAAWVRTAGGEAVGLGVRSGPTVGLFCLATHAGARRRGWGSVVLAALEAWSAAGGATSAWLQVTTANLPAQALYARAGWRRSHGYVHRLAPAGGASS